MRTAEEDRDHDSTAGPYSQETPAPVLGRSQRAISRRIAVEEATPVGELGRRCLATPNHSAAARNVAPRRTAVTILRRRPSAAVFRHEQLLRRIQGNVFKPL